MSNSILKSKDKAKKSICSLFDEVFSSSTLDLSSFYASTDLRIESVEQFPEQIEIYASVSKTSGQCPYCSTTSCRVHSRYTRTIKDLSILGKKVVIHLEARKFFCDNPCCKRKTFAEQPGNEIFRYQRWTRRCELSIVKNGVLCSSYKAMLLLAYAGIHLCRSTILRHLHKMTIDKRLGIKEIGVDDWAMRKGVTYGSIIVDLETSLVVDLLGDRDQDSFERWLEEHQMVNLVSRDRSSEYSSAIKSTGREITEVADRFHLIYNMSNFITKIISEHYQSYRELMKPKIISEPSPVSPSITNAAKNDKPDCPDSRQVLFDEIKKLQSQGMKETTVARTLGVARQTVHKYFKWDKLHPRASKVRNDYSSHDEQVQKEFLAGVPMRQIFENIKSRGFKGSLTPFYDHYRCLLDSEDNFRTRLCQKSKEKAEEKDAKRKAIKELKANTPNLLSIKTLSYITEKSLRDKKMTESEKTLVAKLLRLDWYTEMYNAAASFFDVMKSHDRHQLDIWIRDHETSSIDKIRTFVYGIKMDIEAVKESVVNDVSNGITEGFVNKLKEVKRTMYGKASLTLLKIKMIKPALFFN